MTQTAYFVLQNGVIVGRAYGEGEPFLLPGQTAILASDYEESAVGSAPAWPRLKRNALLAASDWTQLSDVALSATQIATAKSYRAALRDLPATSASALGVSWPAAPAFL